MGTTDTPTASARNLYEHWLQGVETYILRAMDVASDHNWESEVEDLHGLRTEVVRLLEASAASRRLRPHPALRVR